MLRGRDFQGTLNKTIEYGGKAMTAYNIGKAAYTAGRFILPLILYRQRKLLHSVRETGRRITHYAGCAIRTASNVHCGDHAGYHEVHSPAGERSAYGATSTRLGYQ
jgi:hypothetical protein